MKKVGIFLSRVSPPHHGHLSVIYKMAEECDDVLIIIGSASSERNIRVPFTYLERRNFLRKIFPTIKIVGLSDIKDDDIWNAMLDDLVYSVFGECDTVFYGGSQKDVEFYYNFGKTVKIIDRAKIPINATAIRQMMMLGQDISELVDARIAEEVVSKFKEIMLEDWN